MIREMTDADLDRVVRLEQKIFSSPWSLRNFRYELNDNPFANLYVYEADGEIAGYCDLQIKFENADLALIAVAPEYRRSGIAQEMLDFMIDLAVRAECEIISLEVRKSNEPAIRLYEKNGFIQANIRKNYYSDNHEDAYLMIKPLGGF